MSPCTRMEEARKLPLGHTERAAASRALVVEYGACQKRQRELHETLMPFKLRHRLGPGSASCTGYQSRQIIAHLDKECRVRRCNLIEATSPGAGGFYRSQGKTIGLPSLDHIYILTLLHEYAHHLFSQEKMRGAVHGEQFIFCLEWIYNVLETTRFLHKVMGLDVP